MSGMQVEIKCCSDIRNALVLAEREDLLMALQQRGRLAIVVWPFRFRCAWNLPLAMDIDAAATAGG